MDATVASELAIKEFCMNYQEEFSFILLEMRYLHWIKCMGKC
ncbi:hypothetical protein IGM_02194 [Bacillus cereus HuB4-4]|uniref:Uncharacterized protein n=1 Tax=Bacillus cereus HuB4-4 TaxID=1053211 RepID=A0A9W5QWC7_BACCE|nr:hypothetical protein IGM_02194 [Bacillus cereus HuB4-4]